MSNGKIPHFRMNSPYISKKKGSNNNSQINLLVSCQTQRWKPWLSMLSPWLLYRDTRLSQPNSATWRSAREPRCQCWCVWLPAKLGWRSTPKFHGLQAVDPCWSPDQIYTLLRSSSDYPRSMATMAEECQIEIQVYPEIGVPPNHPYFSRMFHEITHPLFEETSKYPQL